MRDRDGPEPLASLFAAPLHEVVQREGRVRGRTIGEPAHDLAMEGFAVLRGPLIERPITAKEVGHEALCQHHLTSAHHAAPAAVCGELVGSDRREAAAVGEPDAAGKVLGEGLDAWVIHATVVVRHRPV